MTKPLNLSGVPNRKALLAECRRRGWPVETGNGGEVRVTTPDQRHINLNNRRKDGALVLVVALRKHV